MKKEDGEDEVENERNNLSSTFQYKKDILQTKFSAQQPIAAWHWMEQRKFPTCIEEREKKCAQLSKLCDGENIYINKEYSRLIFFTRLSTNTATTANRLAHMILRCCFRLIFIFSLCLNFSFFFPPFFLYSFSVQSYLPVLWTKTAVYAENIKKQKHFFEACVWWEWKRVIKTTNELFSVHFLGSFCRLFHDHMLIWDTFSLSKWCTWRLQRTTRNASQISIAFFAWISLSTDVL